MGLGLKAAPLRASLPTQPCSRPSRATASSSRAIWSRGGPVGQSPVPLPAGELGTHWEASDTQQLATAFPSRLRHWQKFTVKVSSVRLLKSHFLTLPGPNVSTQWVSESPATRQPERGHPDRATTARSRRAWLLPRGAVGLCRVSGASKGTRAAARAARHGADGASTRARAAGAITSCALG